MAEQPLLTQTREWWGRWWLPEQPEEVYVGVVTFDPNKGPRLRTVGGFNYRVFEEPTPGVTSFTGEVRRWSVVHGVAENTRMTLLECVVVSAMSYNLDAPDMLEIQATTLLVGCHLDDAELKAFVQATAAIENLTFWSRQVPISGSINFSQDRETITAGELRVVPVPDLVAELDEFTVHLQHTISLPHRVTNRSDSVGTVRHSAELAVKFPEPVSLATALEPLTSLRDMVSFATNDSCAILWQRVYFQGDQDEDRVDPERHYFPQLVDCYRRQQVRSSAESETPQDSEVLFTLSNIGFDVIVPRWFQMRHRFQAALNMVLGLRYGYAGYLETRVSTAVSAAEAMHRALNPQPPIPTVEFNQLRRTILAAVPADRRDWLGALVARNEPSLRMRLLDLAARLDAPVGAQVAPNPARWAKVATNARNNLAHTGHSPKHTLEELYAVGEVTSAIVILNLLQELGLSTDALAKDIANIRVIGTAAELSRTFFPPDGSVT